MGDHSDHKHIDMPDSTFVQTNYEIADLRDPLSSLFEAKLFRMMLLRLQSYENLQFQCAITSLILVLEQKIVLPRYRKSYPQNREMYSYLTFDLNFKFKLR
jgi:hypothetical protein